MEKRIENLGLVLKGKIICPFDKEPCSQKVASCEVVFGNGSGKEVVLFRCERFLKCS